MNIKQKHCGYVTIIGKANVGKSTLMNQIIGKKISIVSRKKNTTQNNIIGVKTQKHYQAIYVDTPGITIDMKGKSFINKEDYFYKIMKNSTLIMFVIDRFFWTENDENILRKIKEYKVSIIIIINKVDKIKNKNILLPFIDFLKTKDCTKEIIPISAKKTKNIIFLNKIICSYLPYNPHIYPKDHITDNSRFFTMSETIRETLISFLGDELPSILKVQVESFQIKKNKELYIRAIILVQNIQQKKIVIGHNGEKIKKISIISRKNLEKEFSVKIHLILWVKVNLKKKHNQVVKI